MKKLLISLVILVSCLSAHSQTNTISTNSVIDAGPLWADLSTLASSTNLTGAAYGIYDLTSHKAGGGVALIYDLGQYLGTAVRYDWINGGFQRVAGTAQLQARIRLFNKADLTPFIFTGVSTVVAGSGSEALMISGIGAAIGINKTWSIGADYELWGDHRQVRGGVIIHF